MLYCKDLEGRPVVFVKGSLFKKTDLDKLMKQYLVYQFEKADRNTTNQGWAVVLDANNLSVLRSDYGIHEFFIEMLNSYYPLAIKYALVVDMPRTMSWLSRIMTRLMNVGTRGIVQFVSQKKLRNFLSKSDIPNELGGDLLLERFKHVIPNGSKPLTQCPHLNLTQQQINSFRDIYRQELQGLDFIPTTETNKFLKFIGK